MILLKLSGVITLKTRKKDYGTANIVGRNVETLRKLKGIKQRDFVLALQHCGVDINPTSYSKLEGQLRVASDKELLGIAKVLEMTVDSLYIKIEPEVDSDNTDDADNTENAKSSDSVEDSENAD